ncbi:MAG: hypothetical protein Fur0010_06690 [Bdellovibrio sp.]
MKKFYHVLLVLILFSSCSQMPWQKNSAQNQESTPQTYLGQIRQRLIDNYANILFCYERYGTEQAQGQITIKVVINKHGSVNSVSLIKDSLKDLKIKGCVIKTVSAIMFPPHKNKNDVELIQPLNFSAKGK